MGLPLENVRVIDFGQYVAGPAAAMILADQGAEVIRIDPPGGVRWKSPAMDTLNRRKKSIILDLKNDGDKQVAVDLIRTADILIENFRPGVMARLGLGAEQMHKVNPRLIYASIPGFAAEDKERAHLAAWEGIIAAASGQFTDMGLNRVLMGVNPSFSPLTLASGYAALLAATGISSALYAREETGQGEQIEIPIAAALMEGLVYNSMYIEDCPDRYLSLRELEIARRKKEGQALNMSYDEIQEYMDPFYRSYFCKDGRPMYVVCTCHIDHCHKALKVMGLYDQVREAGLSDLDDWYLSTSEWPEGLDCALGLYPLTKKWADLVSEMMKKRFLEKTSSEWQALFDEGNVPIVRHHYAREWLNHEHPLAAGLVHEIDHPTYGKRRQAGPVAWLKSSAELASAGTPPPAPDQHRQEILDLIETHRTDVSGPAPTTRDRGWLAGIKILDLTNVIAGPTVANTLARFGAETIKIYPVKPTFDPWNTVLIGLQVQRGKKSILLNIKTGEGKEAFKKLIGWADVVTFNGPDRQLKPLGLDPESLAKVNPRAILFQLDAWGGPKTGPRSNCLGYDDLVQASTGIMARFGGSIKTPEEHAHLGTIDVLTGFSGAFAVATALYKQRVTGETDVARTSLCACGQLLAIPFMYDYEGRAPFDEPSGPQVVGEGPLYRCYLASDQWFFLAAGTKSCGDLENITELKGAAELVGAELEHFLSERFRTETAGYWIDQLVKLDFGATTLGSLSSLREKYLSDQEAGRNGSGPTFQFTSYKDHPSGRRVDIIAPVSIRPRYSPLTIPAPAEKYGRDTREILTSLGYNAAQVDEMIEQKVASESWSKQYLPD
ncbi:CoA transferase [Desulforhopalus singaporensis]|uniref:Dimethylsulfoniopropionate cleavage enzyme DddD n=1 Tax=Desulforhopalus singaporensis TaxID=91360 RepID=A0A1H0TBY3_9BACT|nr:CoA transferase [Desulforhopalus singaporensis]SDP51200.1 dimethylsulfoniopropionate cleavage enzyme DddD [Desulforhopalus singaporensis]